MARDHNRFSVIAELISHAFARFQHQYRRDGSIRN